MCARQPVMLYHFSGRFAPHLKMGITPVLPLRRATEERHWVEPQPGWDSALGLRIDELTPTRVVGYVDIDERHQQAYGIVHGGVWASIVESVGSHGAAVAAHERTGSMAVVGVANSTDFLRPHRAGPVRATGTPIHSGRTQQIWLVEIEREDDGKLIARGQLRVQNLPTPPERRD
jgi:1,4-dihydroxy-2-naphthoyl-CoA hydrolase